MYFLLVNNVGNFELIFFLLKFMLLVNKFLSENSFFVVQIKENI